MQVTWASAATLAANKLMLEERNRQQTREGYTPAHDDEHTEGQLALLAVGYTILHTSEHLYVRGFLTDYLKSEYGWKLNPKDPIRDLVRAGALILAELERRLRVNQSNSKVQGKQ